MQNLRPPPPPPPPPTSDSAWYYSDLLHSDSDLDVDFAWDPPAPPPPPFFFSSNEDYPEASDNASDSSFASCPICQDDIFSPGTTVQHLPCTHAYHRHCIMSWLQDKSTCPVCRFQIPFNDLDLIHSPSLAGPPFQYSHNQFISSITLPEMLALQPPPPPPPLPPSPIQLLHLTEAEPIIRPSVPASTTREESVHSPPTQLPPHSLAVLRIDNETHSVSQSSSTGRFHNAPLHSPSLATPVPLQRSQIQFFSSAILPEQLPSPPPPPLLLLPPAQLIQHQRAPTPFPPTTHPREAETIIQPSASAFTTTEESVQSTPTQLPPNSPAVSRTDHEIHSVSQSSSKGRFRNPLCWSWWRRRSRMV